MTGTAWGRFRNDVREAVVRGAPEQQARLTWSSEQISREQTNALRKLLAHAAEYSPFHARRLSSIDVSTVDPSDLAKLPVMTKTQMMESLGDVFTDRRLCCSDIEAALAETHDQPVPLLDGEYVALASGGCSGRRGLFAFDRSAMTSFFTSVLRVPPADHAAPAIQLEPVDRITMVAAPAAVHATGFAGALTTDDGWPVRFEVVPATLPVPQIVKRLNEIQPKLLGGYASMLTRLSYEVRAGRLDIAPALVSPTSETLLPEMRRAIGAAFGVPVVDGFACTEGLTGKTLPNSDVFVFNTDMCIVELVDADNQPVPQGIPSSKVLVTNLHNMTQPLIRYELNDVFVQQPGSTRHGYLRAAVQGRSDDVLRFGNVDVHPIVVRSVMVSSAAVIDYQVSQIHSGIEISVVAVDAFDANDLTRELQRALGSAGVDRVDVKVRRVDQLDRDVGSGKLRRFLSSSS